MKVHFPIMSTRYTLSPLLRERKVLAPSREGPFYFSQELIPKVNILISILTSYMKGKKSTFSFQPMDVKKNP